MKTEFCIQCIEESQICRVAFADEGKTPYILPMCFGFDRKHIYLHSKKNGKKIRILNNNPRVCLLFEHHVHPVENPSFCEWGFEYRTVVVEGEAVFLNSLDDKIYGLNRIVLQYAGETAGSFDRKELASTEVIRITLQSVTAKENGQKAEEHDI